MHNKEKSLVDPIERVYASGVLEDLKAAIAGLDPELLADPEAMQELYACMAQMEAKVFHNRRRHRHWRPKPPARE